jgi:hypothetical protein
MKTRSVGLLMLALSAFLLQGCIAFPPLIQVEHKDSSTNAEILRRLDAIDKRLDKLEEKSDKK